MSCISIHCPVQYLIRLMISFPAALSQMLLSGRPSLDYRRACCHFRVSRRQYWNSYSGFPIGGWLYLGDSSDGLGVSGPWVPTDGRGLLAHCHGIIAQSNYQRLVATRCQRHLNQPGRGSIDKAYVERFRALLFDSAVGNVNSTHAVTDDMSDFLGVAKVSECVASTCGLRCKLSFCRRGHYSNDGATEVVNGPVETVHGVVDT
jgi:hypothetical protein